MKPFTHQEVGHAIETIGHYLSPRSPPAFTTFDPLIGHIKVWLEPRNNSADTWFRCFLV